MMLMKFEALLIFTNHLKSQKFGVTVIPDIKNPFIMVKREIFGHSGKIPVNRMAHNPDITNLDTMKSPL